MNIHIAGVAIFSVEIVGVFDDEKLFFPFQNFRTLTPTTRTHASIHTLRDAHTKRHAHGDRGIETEWYTQRHTQTKTHAKKMHTHTQT